MIKDKVENFIHCNQKKKSSLLNGELKYDLKYLRAKSSDCSKRAYSSRNNIAFNNF